MSEARLCAPNSETRSVLMCLEDGESVGSVGEVSMCVPAGFCLLPLKSPLNLTGAAPVEALITNATAGSLLCVSGASDKVLTEAVISGISFPLSHVFAFAMGTFLVNSVVFLVRPRNKLLKGTEVRPMSSGESP